MLGFKGPRKMTIVIPAMSMDQQRVDVCPLGAEPEGIIGMGVSICFIFFYNILFISSFGLRSLEKKAH